VPGAPNIAFDAGDTLWITDYTGDRLWKLDR